MERNFISHNVIADASQLIAERFGSKACICLRNLAIIVASKLLTVSAGQMGGFDECPAKIPVTIFAIAMTFAFAVWQALGRYTAAIGGKISDFGKPADISDLQHNGHRQDIADARDCE